MNQQKRNIVIIVCIFCIIIGLSLQSISGRKLINSFENINNSITTPGDYDKFIFVDGRVRSYRIHIPSEYDDQEPVPLLFALHGWPSNSYRLRWASELNEKSDEEGFIVVYPNGHIILSYIPMTIQNYLRDIKAPWELGWNFWDQDQNPANDIHFIDSLINHFVEHYNVNNSRIYVCGISGGACMSYRLGSELTTKIAAIAPVAGTIGGIWDVPEPNNAIEPYIIPEPTSPLPVIIFHGTHDEAVMYDGGWRYGDDKIRIHPYGPPSWIYLLSVNQSVSFWVEHNNCNPTPITTYSHDNTIIKQSYENGDDGSEVKLFTVVGGGHVWFGSRGEIPYESFINNEMWDFFETHPKK